MRLLLLSDIHGHLDALKAIKEVLTQTDVVVIAGDITHFGHRRDAERVMDALCQAGPVVVAVHGNCDGTAVQEVLADRQVGAHGRTITVGDLTFAGAGGSLFCSGRTPCELDEQHLAGALEATGISNQDRLVLVTHHPAYGTELDKIRGSHAGSRSIRAFIDRHKPVLAVSGHFHEAPGQDQIGPTVLVNPGPIKNGYYAVAMIDGAQVQIKLIAPH